ncbi:hypothetical protein HYH03_015034 [Edaphochlamys debaryana]|uniref:Uncharacterized protein n=1 Tax=Edaphochlamys debaryana TaxID=47281 RepID=A0A835XMT0_9CHLO|nr:hypothetical protein HYH03_015034 [Edaphochlamys debaryana]|eukprot:KAG2486330.1 hypothetical protein HYH03_015034 [Edaphochlamys debaryana]
MASLALSTSQFCPTGRARPFVARSRPCLPRRRLLPVARAAATAQQQRTQRVQPEVEEEEADPDFYSLLGISPLADTKEIKRAYYSMMRTCHPDLSRAGSGSLASLSSLASYDDVEATEFCKLLNEIYETLTDPNRRALYDELAGFSAESVNPFLDDRYAADRVFVDEFTCIGCRNCNNVCPKTFGMEEEYGRARVMKQDVDTESKLQEAIDTCPVSCIHWVTAPQLSLLETAMGRMGRIAVWSMMGGMGANKDVFTEASLAWTRRQSEIRARVEEAASAMRAKKYAAEEPSVAWNFWTAAAGFGNGASKSGSAGSSFYEEADAKRKQQQEAKDSGADAGGREGKGVADLAARAARAARTWRRFQEVAAASRRERLVLASTSSAASMDAE